MARKTKPHGNALTATLAGMLILAACTILGESIQLERQDGQIAEGNAHADALQAKVEWFNARLHERPPVDVPAAEAAMDDE